MIAHMDLTERDRKVLALESRYRRHSGAKEIAIREMFGVLPARYYQWLNALIDRPEALVADPLLVKSLLRARARRSAARTTRAFGS